MARPTPDLPNSSMADIAFLMLAFFLMTTTVANDKGILITLPPPPEALPPEDIEIQERNLFKIQVNSFDNVLVESNPWGGTDRELIDQMKAFVLNNGVDPTSSINPIKAIVSIKTDRGTTHKKFIQILDAAEAAYNEIYATNAGVTVERWREIAAAPNDEGNRELFDRGRGLSDGVVGVPKNISIAEPTKIGGN